MRTLPLASALLLAACTVSTQPQPWGTTPEPYGGPRYAPPPYPAAPPAPTAAPAPWAPPAAADRFAAARQRCVDETNAYRARVGVPPVVARPDKAACTDTDARGDATNHTVHGGSGKCGLAAQNECPGWPGTGAGIVSQCLQSMFAEGPGEPYPQHGHYINMTGRDYRGLACGFYEADGKVWLIQNFFR